MTMGFRLTAPRKQYGRSYEVVSAVMGLGFEFPVSDVSLSISAYGKRYFIEVTTLHSPCQYREQNLFPAKTETNPD
jgi:hypothetical protein